MRIVEINRLWSLSSRTRAAASLLGVGGAHTCLEARCQSRRLPLPRAPPQGQSPGDHWAFGGGGHHVPFMYTPEAGAVKRNWSFSGCAVMPNSSWSSFNAAPRAERPTTPHARVHRPQRMHRDRGPLASWREWDLCAVAPGAAEKAQQTGGLRKRGSAYRPGGWFRPLRCGPRTKCPTCTCDHTQHMTRHT
jgi:hypothetical protein